ncbi:MAG: hypothetical protein JNL01_02290 [Bdellovibrionales bacterium]|nr:hypothetical protein [Bdellovibrionales bacterium]
MIRWFFTAALTSLGLANNPLLSPLGYDHNLGLQPGFYSVKETPACHSRYGKVIFAYWNRPDPNIDYRESLGRGTRGEFKVGLKSIQTDEWFVGDPKDNCTIRFETSRMQPLGVCSEFQAHRGDVRIFPANSIRAFHHALEEGFAGFELDLQLSSDGVAVVSHDDRLGPASDCKGRVRKKTWEQIKSCRLTHSPLIPEAGIFGQRALVDAPIPSLKMVFEEFSKDPRVRKIHLDIKPKNKPEELVKAIQAALPTDPKEREALESRITILAKEPEDLIALNDAFPLASVALEGDATISGLIDRSRKNYWGPENCYYDTLSVAYGTIFNPFLQFLKVLRGEGTGDAGNFKRLYRRNLQQGEDAKKILGWTLNSKNGIRKLRNFHLEDILTDVPMQKLVEILYDGMTDTEILANIDEMKKKGQIAACDRPEFKNRKQRREEIRQQRQKNRDAPDASAAPMAEIPEAAAPKN